MKSTTIIYATLLITFFLVGCSKTTSEEKINTARLETSDQSAAEILKKHDQSIGSIMKTIRQLKNSIKNDGAKVTPTIEANITDMITEAKGYQSQLSELTDKLSKGDYDLFERNSKRLREKETEFETLKQTK